MRGSNLMKAFEFLLKTPMYWISPHVLMISPPPNVLMVSLRCTEHPQMYSWYPLDVLSSPEARVIYSNNYHLEARRDSGNKGNKWTKERLCGGEYPRCTHGIPPMHWTSPDVRNTHYTGWLMSCRTELGIHDKGYNINMRGSLPFVHLNQCVPTIQ